MISESELSCGSEIHPSTTISPSNPGDTSSVAWLTSAKRCAVSGSIGFAIGMVVLCTPEYGLADQFPIQEQAVQARDEKLADESRSALLGNAAIHFVFVGTADEEKNYVISQQRSEALRSEELRVQEAIAGYESEPDSAFTGLRESLSELTSGAYEPFEPTSITWEDSGARLSLINDCVTTNRPEQHNAILAIGRKLYKPDAINIVVTDAPSCTPEKANPNYQLGGAIGSFGGFAGPNGTLINGSRLVSDFEDVVVHELGHMYGLPHAAKAFCANPAGFGGCTVKPLSDNNTLMSYSDVRLSRDGSPRELTNAEEYILGVLPEDEVLENPADGIMKISANSYIYSKFDVRPSNLPRVIVDTTGDSPVFISVEREVAKRSIKCGNDMSSSEGDTLVDAYVRGVNVPRLCMLNEALPAYEYAVQVRTPMDENGTPQPNFNSGSTMAVIDTTRNDTQNSEGKPLDLLANGYTNPTVLYENDNTKYTLTGVDKVGIATIKKEAIHLWDKPFAVIKKLTGKTD